MSAPNSAFRFILTGRVQGLGVRPAIYNLAQSLGLGGAVRNTSRGVEIEVEGRQLEPARFEQSLANSLPVGSQLESLTTELIQPTGRHDFKIIEQKSVGQIVARVPPDVSICQACLAELNDSNDRRFRYPFISCTACGPRYSIINEMPYERYLSTMDQFVFCSPCRDEYTSPADRRFHAQTNACPVCGPELWSADARQRVSGRRDGAIKAAVSAIHSGQIVALRGLGGYQLLVDATNEKAVRRLRERKRRRSKPLAVMVQSVDQAKLLAQLDQTERNALSDQSNPIVICTAKSDANIASSIYLHLHCLGLMLPTTPLHALLTQDAARPLVCTSGNLDGDPLQHEVYAAEQHLADVADLWLHHDRPIAQPIDDSVVRVIAGRPVTIRLARGLAPLPLDLPLRTPMLALGGYLKTAVALSNGAQSILGPHVGDHETLATRERFLTHFSELQRLYQFQPQTLVHDMHPEYFSTTWANQQAVPCHAVQHHHAHVVAGMLEHGWLDRTVMGVSWDGTGFGPDETIWGGEFLISRADRFTRFATFRRFCLPGGESAIHQPWRIAMGLVSEAMGTDHAVRILGDDAGRTLVLKLLNNRRFSPLTTSVGRLFDAVGVIALGIDEADFDGDVAMRLEAAADRAIRDRYHFALQVNKGQPMELDWRPMIVDLVADRDAGVDASSMSMKFHRALAWAIVQVCRRRPQLPTVLSGGVFQNRLLTELVCEFWEGQQPLGTPGIIPPNDGGLAVGQLAVAAAREKTLCV